MSATFAGGAGPASFQGGVGREETSTCGGCATRDETIAWQQKLMLEMARVLVRMQAAIDALKAQVRQDSRNSHRPPSTDPPDAKGKPGAKRKGRKPGGQPGHEGRSRPLIPSEDVDESFDVHPPCCGKCGRSGLEPTGAKPWRHQTWEIPEIDPAVTEHRLHADLCPHCGAVTRAGLPHGVPAGSFGPRLMALVCLLHGRYRVSLRNIEEFLSDAFGVEVSLGSLKNIEDKVSDALAPPFAELHEAVKASEVPANADETSWRERGKRRYLWAVVVPFAAVYLVRGSRAAKVAKELLGAVRRVVVTDRYKGYDWIPIWFRQLCLAHLRRDARKMEDRGGEAGRIGAAFGAAIDEVFHLWHRVRAGTLARSTLRRKISPIRSRIERLLLDGTAVPSIAGMCSEILRLEPAINTFVRVEGVPPTNNTAETSVRHPVLWRKVSFGTWSEAGSRYVERILTTVATLRLQNRNVLDYLTEACKNAIAGHAAPSLLPPEATASFLAA